MVNCEGLAVLDAPRSSSSTGSDSDRSAIWRGVDVLVGDKRFSLACERAVSGRDVDVAERKGGILGVGIRRVASSGRLTSIMDGRSDCGVLSSRDDPDSSLRCGAGEMVEGCEDIESVRIEIIPD
jgi:hypothetical protein